MCKCLSPVVAWACGTTICADGIVSPRLVFNPTEAQVYFEGITGGLASAFVAMERNTVSLPCGKCAYCSIKKRKDMTVRLTHETSLYKDCCFITLTYAPEHLPVTNLLDWKDLHDRGKIIERGSDVGCPTLLPRDVQLFMKRLRRHLEYIPKKHSDDVRDHVLQPIRFFAVGEYGGKTKRPHYHIMIFGWKPSDQIFHQERDGYFINRSAQIEKLWPFGFSTVTDVGFGIARYCARYVTKKFDRLTDEDDVLSSCICPEFTLQSVAKGGIGSPWLSLYAENLRYGFVTCRTGKYQVSKFAIPRYYLNRLRTINKSLWLDLRDQRIDFAKSHNRDYDFDDLVRTVHYNEVLHKLQDDRESI